MKFYVETIPSGVTALGNYYCIRMPDADGRAVGTIWQDALVTEGFTVFAGFPGLWSTTDGFGVLGRTLVPQVAGPLPYGSFPSIGDALDALVGITEGQPWKRWDPFSGKAVEPEVRV